MIDGRQEGHPTNGADFSGAVGALAPIEMGTVGAPRRTAPTVILAVVTE